MSLKTGDLCKVISPTGFASRLGALDPDGNIHFAMMNFGHVPDGTLTLIMSDGDDYYDPDWGTRHIVLVDNVLGWLYEKEMEKISE